MGSEWREVTLGEIARGLTVGFVGSMARHYVDQGIPFLRSQDILPYRINLTDIKYITPEFNAEIRKSQLRPGDVVIVRTGKPGTAAVVPEAVGALNCSDLVIVRPGEHLDSNFLCYYINTLASGHVAAHLVGAVQQHFNVGSAKQLEMKVPPLPIQRQIAAILSAFDDKIELNRQMNRTLEQMARALFKSWFVDFDPVRAKMRGEVPEGMNAETAALFPDELVEIEGREVPRGWRIGKLADAVQFNAPLSLVKNQEATYLDMGSMPTETMSANGWFARPFGSGSRFQNGDTLFARITPCLENGKAAYVDFLKEGEVGWGSTEYIVMRPLKSTPQLLPYILCRDTDFRAYAVGNMNGSSGRQRVSYQSLSEYPLVLPDNAIFNLFNEITMPVLEQAKSSRDESTELAQLRDALLPRLLSGEVNVGDWETAIESASGGQA